MIEMDVELMLVNALGEHRQDIQRR